MGLRARILRVTTETGSRPIAMLRGLARGKENFASTFARMRARGEIVMHGERKGATYGPPKKRVKR